MSSIPYDWRDASREALALTQTHWVVFEWPVFTFPFYSLYVGKISDRTLWSKSDNTSYQIDHPTDKKNLAKELDLLHSPDDGFVPFVTNIVAMNVTLMAKTMLRESDANSMANTINSQRSNSRSQYLKRINQLLGLRLKIDWPYTDGPSCAWTCTISKRLNDDRVTLSDGNETYHGAALHGGDKLHVTLYGDPLYMNAVIVRSCGQSQTTISKSTYDQHVQNARKWWETMFNYGQFRHYLLTLTIWTHNERREPVSVTENSHLQIIYGPPTLLQIETNPSHVGKQSVTYTVYANPNAEGAWPSLNYTFLWSDGQTYKIVTDNFLTKRMNS